MIDGVNEAMVLHGVKIDLEGWSLVRRRVIDLFKRAGVTVLECDHLPMSSDPLRGDAYGTVHKGNVVDGVRFALVRKERFGRGRRGRAGLYSTKDRNGQVELHGVDNDSGSVYIGMLVVDDTDTTPDFLTIYAPKADEDAPPVASALNPVEVVYEVVAALPEHEVRSSDLLYAEVRKAGHQIKDKAIRDAAADLVVVGRFVETSGKRGAKGYQAVIPTSARGSDEWFSPKAPPRPRRSTPARRLPTGDAPRWAEVRCLSSAYVSRRGAPRWAEVKSSVKTSRARGTKRPARSRRGR